MFSSCWILFLKLFTQHFLRPFDNLAGPHWFGRTRTLSAFQNSHGKLSACVKQPNFSRSTHSFWLAWVEIYLNSVTIQLRRLTTWSVICLSTELNRQPVSWVYFPLARSWAARWDVHDESDRLSPESAAGSSSRQGRRSNSRIVTWLVRLPEPNLTDTWWYLCTSCDLVLLCCSLVAFLLLSGRLILTWNLVKQIYWLQFAHTFLRRAGTN